MRCAVHSPVLGTGENTASRLHLQVANTIATLASADIRLWVLTGDKVETVNEGGIKDGELDHRGVHDWLPR